MGFGGIDIRQSGDRLILRAFLQDGDGEIVTTGSAVLRLYELQHDGSLKSYDFADHQFKTAAVTTEESAMTHQAGNGGGRDTGLWSGVLDTLSGFSCGGLYLAVIAHDQAFPGQRCREFQFGGTEGDLDPAELHLCKAALVNKRQHTIDTGVDRIYDDDGTTVLRTMTPSETDGIVAIDPT